MNIKVTAFTVSEKSIYTCVAIYNRFWKCDIKGAPDGILKGKKIAIKDNCCVAGVPMRNGTSLLDGYTPDMDATVVTSILDAGKALRSCFAIQAVLNLEDLTLALILY